MRIYFSVFARSPTTDRPTDLSIHWYLFFSKFQFSIPEYDDDLEVSMFRFGLALGLGIPLVFWVFYLGKSYPTSVFPRFDSVIIVYRMLGLVILLLWCWLVNHASTMHPTCLAPCEIHSSHIYLYTHMRIM